MPDDTITLDGRKFTSVSQAITANQDDYILAHLRVAGAIVYPSEFPRTRDRIVSRGFPVVTTACGEIAKAEGAVTCCSLIFEAAVAHEPTSPHAGSGR